MPLLDDQHRRSRFRPTLRGERHRSRRSRRSRLKRSRIPAFVTVVSLAEVVQVNLVGQIRNGASGLLVDLRGCMIAALLRKEVHAHLNRLTCRHRIRRGANVVRVTPGEDQYRT